jgi:acetyltransferase-like isoleucine patch superfamily enzyme
MKQFLKLFLLLPLRKIRWSYLYVLHSIFFRIMKVKYQEMPEIFGRLIINNNGRCSFGKGLTFRSDLTSNFVGLYKPCTVVISKEGSLEIEDYTGFSGVSIYCTNNIKIGKYCKFGGNVSIWDTDFHPLNFEDRRWSFVGTKTRPIVIGDDVFVGANSIILKGVSIGDRVIIGAGSVITKNIPSDEIWAGNPAKFIRKLNE